MFFIEQHPTPEVLAALAARTLEVLPQFEAQHLSNTLLGAAKLEWDPGADFLDSLAQEALKKLESFTAQVNHNVHTHWSSLVCACGQTVSGVKALQPVLTWLDL